MKGHVRNKLVSEKTYALVARSQASFFECITAKARNGAYLREIGLAKAVVMVSRLNLFWGLHWAAVPEHLTGQSDVSNFDVVIGCVDTRAGRRLIQTKVQGWRSRVAYWLDLGNAADTGQFVLGQPLNGRNRRCAERLRIAPELFPEIAEPSLERDETPSCGALEALERQEPFVNQVLAQHALALLTRLFLHGRIDHHGAFVSVRENRVQPIPINTTLWRKMGRRGRRLIQTEPALAARQRTQ